MLNGLMLGLRDAIASSRPRLIDKNLFLQASRIGKRVLRVKGNRSQPVVPDKDGIGGKTDTTAS
jgi:hypothetical protein